MGTTSCTLLKLPVLLHSFKKNALKISIKLLVYMRNWATRNTSRQAAWRLSLQHRSPEAPELLQQPAPDRAFWWRGSSASLASTGERLLPRGRGHSGPFNSFLNTDFCLQSLSRPWDLATWFSNRAQALASTASPRAVSFNGRYPSQAPSDLASDCRGRNEKPYVPPWAAARHRNNISKNSQNNL